MPLDSAAESVQSDGTDSKIEELSAAGEQEAERIAEMGDRIEEHEWEIHELRQQRVDCYLRQAERLSQLKNVLHISGSAFVQIARDRFKLGRSTAYDLIHVHENQAAILEQLEEGCLEWSLEAIIEYATGREPRHRSSERQQWKEEKQSNPATKLFGKYARSNGDRITPQWLFDRLNAIYKFVLDAMASKDNTKVKGSFITEKQDTLIAEWPKTGNIWINSPFRNKIIEAVLVKARDHARNHGVYVVCLVPAWLYEKWFYEIAIEAEIKFIPQAVTFEDYDEPFLSPLCVLIFSRVSHYKKNLAMFDFDLRKP